MSGKFFDASQHSSFYDENSEAIISFITPGFYLNFSFAARLLYLEKQAIEIQYQLAYLSTLGGAYHLCNNPRKALTIAYEQEKVGHKLGSTAIIIRSKVFQAVNLGLLGEQNTCVRIFQNCKSMAVNCNWTDMLSFVTASEQWFIMNHLVVEHKKKLARKSNKRDVGRVSPSVQEIPVI
jgi:hypothetical protein